MEASVGWAVVDVGMGTLGVERKSRCERDQGGRGVEV